MCDSPNGFLSFFIRSYTRYVNRSDITMEPLRDIQIVRRLWMSSIYVKESKETKWKPKHILFSTFAHRVYALAPYTHITRGRDRGEEQELSRYELCINDVSNRTESNILLCTITIKGVLLLSYSTIRQRFLVLFLFDSRENNLRRKLDESCHRVWKMGCFVFFFFVVAKLNEKGNEINTIKLKQVTFHFRHCENICNIFGEQKIMGMCIWRLWFGPN